MFEKVPGACSEEGRLMILIYFHDLHITSKVKTHLKFQSINYNFFLQRTILLFLQL